MRIFKTKGFARFVRREQIADKTLLEAIVQAERGLIEADLGGGLIKQRIARQGKGRRGGYRTIIVYREKDRAVFLFGFAKSEKDNIGKDELVTLKEAAAQWLSAADERLAIAIAANEIQEVEDEKDQPVDRRTA